MVKMRLVRLGDKRNPIYRVVVADARKAASAHRNGEEPACEGGRYRKIGKAQPRKNQRQEVQEVIKGSLHSVQEKYYAGID